MTEETTESEESEQDGYTSSLLARTLSWYDPLKAEWPADLSIDLAAEAWLWQGISQRSDLFLVQAMLAPFSVRGRGKRHLTGDEPDRLQELLRIMGSIGEQAGLAWTAYIDAQRIAATKETRDEVLHRLTLRAVAEHSAHFILGSANGLSNLVLRTLLLNVKANPILIGHKKYSSANGFPPNVDHRDTWVTFDVGLADRLYNAAKDAGNPDMLTLISALRSLKQDPAFAGLEDRRGLDYHRMRPQSVITSGNARMPTTNNPGTSGAFAVGSPVQQPLSDETVVLKHVADTAPVLASTMKLIAGSIGDAIRSENISFEADRDWEATRASYLAVLSKGPTDKESEDDDA